MGLQGGELSRRGDVARDVKSECTGTAEGLRIRKAGQNPGPENNSLGDYQSGSSNWRKPEREGWPSRGIYADIAAIRHPPRHSNDTAFGHSVNIPDADGQIVGRKYRRPGRRDWKWQDPEMWSGYI